MSVLDQIQGYNSAVAMKQPVVAASTGNVTLSGLQTMDGVTLAANDRVLAKDQTDATENGIYIVSATEWIRAKDFDGTRDIVTGTLVFVVGGTTNGTHFYRVSSTGTLTPGTSSLAFTRVYYESEANATAAAASATAAAASAVTAEAAADSVLENLSGTSTTTHSISSGSKVFTTQADLAFGVSSYVLISSDADPTTNYMVGQVTAYSGTSLTVNVTITAGSSSYSDWTIRISGRPGDTGAQGPAGAGTGDMLKTENLSGLSNYGTARSNLGLGTAAVATLIDDDTMATATSSNIPSAESVKAYVDANAATSMSWAQVRRSTDQSIAASTWEKLLFDTEDADTAAYHSTVSNTGRLTAPATGFYLVSAVVAITSGEAVGSIRFIKNNTTSGFLPKVAFVPSPGGDSEVPYRTMELSWIFSLSATDYVEVQAYTNQSGAYVYAAETAFQIRRIL